MATILSATVKEVYKQSVFILHSFRIQPDLYL